MASYQTGTLIDLKDREAVSLDNVRGATLRLLRGTLWVTQHDDPQDIVLRDGDNWVVERNGRTVLEAQDDSVVCLVGRDIKPVAQPWVSNTENLPSWLTHVLSLERAFVPYV
ncbi:MAG TPA: DUF2917 domain-containing protein [Casimicrobiaceae bacterium]|nr:DUF2917 domain-containing protein [Casimicrobiaceae bacterium]